MACVNSYFGEAPKGAFAECCRPWAEGDALTGLSCCAQQGAGPSPLEAQPQQHGQALWRAPWHPQLGFPAPRSVGEGPGVGWVLGLASSSVPVSWVAASASSASDPSSFHSIFQHIGPSWERHLENSPDTHLESFRDRSGVWAEVWSVR